MKLTIIFLAFFILNIPFGYLKAGVKKLGIKWFLYLHIPIAIEFLVRRYFNMSYYYIPIFMILLLLGQKFGAYLYKKKL